MVSTPGSPTRAPATPILNPDNDKYTESKLDDNVAHDGTKTMYGAASLKQVDSGELTPLREPAWSKFIPNIYAEGRVLKLSAFQMKWAVQIVAGIAVAFFGFDQGVMSGVNESADYLRLMGTASGVTGSETNRDSAAIGGIVAIYYAGTFIGGFLGGYIADEAGRIKAIFIACLWTILGAALQCSAQNITWMMLARVITGCGTGILNATVPVWVSELSKHNKRGQALGFEFVFNIFGLALVYWLAFGVRDYTTGGFNWRFPLAFQLVFVFMLLVALPFFPESPRWLAKMGRVDESRRILARLRSEPYNEHDERVAKELQEIIAVAKLERVRQVNGEDSFWRMLLDSGGKSHMRRRIILVVWLQILQELAGIGVITVYAPTVFRQGGFSDYTARLLSGFNDVSHVRCWCPAQTIVLTNFDRYHTCFQYSWLSSPWTGLVGV